MASTGAEDLLTDYPVSEGIYDEGFASTVSPRPAARPALEAVARASAARAARRRSAARCSAPACASPRSRATCEFYVDPVPRVITAAEWEPVKRGLAQRVRALNAFVADVYGEQRIVAEGVVPPRGRSRSADYYEPAMRGVRAAGRRLDRRRRAWTSCATHDGEWLVLEDNVRTPSGFAYLHATRRALLEHIDVPPGATPRPLDGEIDLLADALRAAAPGGARGRRAPLAAVLTDGEHNSAYWEHAWLVAPARHPAGRARRARAARRRACGCAPAACASRAGSTSSTAAPTPTALDSDIGRLLIEPRPARARSALRQPVRHRRRRRQAHPRLRRGHDPLLRRRGAGAALGPDLRPRAARPARARRWTSSTSSCSSRAPATAASAS